MGLARRDRQAAELGNTQSLRLSWLGHFSHRRSRGTRPELGSSPQRFTLRARLTEQVDRGGTLGDWAVLLLLAIPSSNPTVASTVLVDSVRSG